MTSDESLNDENFERHLQRSLRETLLQSISLRSKLFWQGKKDSNLRMSESKSDALTNLATPLHGLALANLLPITRVGSIN